MDLQPKISETGQKHSDKTLLISPFFYPEPISTGKYNTDLAINLVKQGHEVHVWCYHPFYPDWKIKKSTKQLKNIVINRGGPYVPFFGKQLIDRFILEISFLFFLFFQKARTKHAFDNVVFVSPPSLSIFLLKTFKKAKQKVIIVHDLQFIHLETKIKWLSKIVFWVEKRLLGYGTKLIFLSKEMNNYFSFKNHKNHIQTYVQLPFVNIKSTPLVKPILKQGVNIVYSGALAAKQSPDQLMSLFQYVAEKEPAWNFYFISSGGYFEHIKGKNQLDNIHFMPLVDEKQLFQLYTESTVQIIPQSPGSSAGSLPSKLPNLVFSKTKILAITDSNSDLERIIKKYPNGVCVNSWNEKDFLTSIKKLIQQNNSIDTNKINEICSKHFSIDSLISKII